MPADNSNLLVYSTIGLVIVTGVLVGATWFYAIQTKKILNETRNTVNEMRRASDIQLLPSLIATFTTTSEGNLSLNIKNIGRGVAKQIKVRFNISGNLNRSEEQDFQVLEAGQITRFPLDAGYRKPPEIGYDPKQIYDYYKQHQTTISIRLNYRDILDKEYSPEEQVIDVTKEVRPDLH